MLQQAVADIGPKRWSAIALAVPGRSGKQCRLRWCNQIDPSIKHDAWTDKEDATILRAYLSCIRDAWHTAVLRQSSPPVCWPEPRCSGPRALPGGAYSRH